MSQLMYGLYPRIDKPNLLQQIMDKYKEQPRPPLLNPETKTPEPIPPPTELPGTQNVTTPYVADPFTDQITQNIIDDLDKKIESDLQKQTDSNIQQQLDADDSAEKSKIAQHVGDKGTNWFSQENIGSYAGAIANPLLAWLDSKAGNTGLTRIREKEVDEALSQNLGNRDRLLNESPEAIRRAKENSLREGMSNVANAGANAGAATSSNAGLGSGINSALIAGIQASAPMAQSTGNMQEAIANTYTQREQAQSDLENRIGRNTMDRGTLAEMTAYHQLNTGINSYKDMLDLIAGGGGVGNKFVKMLQGSVDDTTKSRIIRP